MNEFRIGNLVYADTEHLQGVPYPIKIEGLKFGKIVCYFGRSLTSTTASEFKECGNTQIHPILLNEEWLLKLGINKRILKTQLNGSEDWFDVSRVLLNDDIDNPKWGYLFSMNGESLIIIEYVHQLQNLYFALTGKELITP